MVMKSLKNPSRVLKTPWSERIVEAESKGATLEELAPLISGGVSRNGWRDGSVEQGMYPAGQVIGRIHDVPTMRELVERIVAEAAEAKQAIARL